MKCFAIAFLIASFALAASAKDGADLVVGDTTLVQRCVLKGAESTRMIAVGQPGGFNYAFDAVRCAPTSAWLGGFLDFSGETNARGGNGCKPLGVQQTLGIDDVPLRIGTPDALPGSLRFHGYRRDAKTGEPTFLFEVDGVAVEQQIHSPSPGVVSLTLTFPGETTKKKFYRIDPTPHLQLVLGDGLRWAGPGVIEIPAARKDAQLTIHLKAVGKAFVREVETLSGVEIFRNFCSACHSIDGTKLIGPSFQGLWGREALVIRNGASETIKVDEDYLRESILKPQAAIVKGYEAVPMADFSAVLTKEQIEGLIEFLKEMK